MDDTETSWYSENAQLCDQKIVCFLCAKRGGRGGGSSKELTHDILSYFGHLQANYV